MAKVFSAYSCIELSRMDKAAARSLVLEIPISTPGAGAALKLNSLVIQYIPKNNVFTIN